MTKPYFSALFALLLLPSILAVAETVTFPSGEITLHGVLYKPEGTGTFPAVIYNHGSAPGMMSKEAFAALRSEERRVGKECRCRGAESGERKERNDRDA